jgi:hypothetical protein
VMTLLGSSSTRRKKWKDNLCPNWLTALLAGDSQKSYEHVPDE